MRSKPSLSDVDQAHEHHAGRLKKISLVLKAADNYLLAICFFWKKEYNLTSKKLMGVFKWVVYLEQMASGVWQMLN